MQAHDMTTAEDTDKQYSVRLAPEVAARADALIPVLRRMEHYSAFRMERSTVFRVALVRGLALLEREAVEAGLFEQPAAVASITTEWSPPMSADELDARLRTIADLTRPGGARFTEEIAANWDSYALVMLRRLETELAAEPSESYRHAADDVARTLAQLGPREGRLMARVYEGIRSMFAAAREKENA
jgi:hypothetical protein